MLSPACCYTLCSNQIPSMGPEAFFWLLYICLCMNGWDERGMLLVLQRLSDAYSVPSAFCLFFWYQILWFCSRQRRTMSR